MKKNSTIKFRLHIINYLNLKNQSNSKMKGTAFSLYEKHHIIKNYERLGLFQRLNEKYKIKSVLYPGSYAHITPVFVFPKVIFNDVYKKLQKFL